MFGIIVHIPHSSIKTPNEFNKRLIINIEDFNKESIFEADYLIDLFKPKMFFQLSLIIQECIVMLNALKIMKKWINMEWVLSIKTIAMVNLL